MTAIDWTGTNEEVLAALFEVVAPYKAEAWNRVTKTRSFGSHAILPYATIYGVMVEEPEKLKVEPGLACLTSGEHWTPKSCEYRHFVAISRNNDGRMILRDPPLPQLLFEAVDKMYRHHYCIGEEQRQAGVRQYVQSLFL